MYTQIDCLPGQSVPDITAEVRAQTLPANDWMARSSLDPLLNDVWANAQTAAGEWVDEKIALTCVAVYAAVKVLSETMATFPLVTCSVLADGSEVPNLDNPLYKVLRHRPNKEISAFNWKEVKQSHLCTFGNAYSEIQRNRNGDPIGLWQRTPDRFRPRRHADSHEIYYEYSQPWAGLVNLEASEVVHLAGLGFDGLMGYSVVRVMAESIGCAIGAQRFAAEFFKNDAKPGGVLEYPGQLSDKSFERLKQRWQQSGGTIGQRHRIRILEEGIKWITTQISPEDAQLLVTRKFGVEDVARGFRIPPHFLQDLEHATFSNIEELGLQFLTYTMLPWVERWEDELNYKLLGNDPERVIRFMTNRFLRADVTKRSAAYVQGRQWGWYSANNVRRKENEAPVEGGDEYLSPLNMVPVRQLAAMYGDGADGKKSPTGDSLDGAADRNAALTVAVSRAQRAYSRMALDVAARILKREANALRGAIQKHLQRAEGADREGFAAWSVTFYQGHAEYSRAAIGPLVASAGGALNAVYGDDGHVAQHEALAGRLARQLAGESRELLGQEPSPAKLLAAVEAWPQTRAAEVADSLLLQTAVAALKN